MPTRQKVFPLTTLLILLSTVFFTVWSILRFETPLDKESTYSQLQPIIFIGNTAPFILALLILAGISWRNYLNQKKTLVRWQGSLRTLARITLDLEAHDATYHTIPERHKSRELTKVYQELNDQCLDLLKQQEKIEKLAAGSRLFREEVEKFEKAIDSLDKLAQTHMASGNYYEPAKDIQTVFDVLIRPLDLRAREILFFLEDIPGRDIPKASIRAFRSSFEEIRALTQESRDPQQQQLIDLDRMLKRWHIAEMSLASTTQRIIGHLLESGSLSTEVLADVLGTSERYQNSLTVLRKVLGLPISGEEAAESYLEQAACLAYFSANQSWRPVSQRPGHTRPLNFVEATRVNSYLASTDELVFKGRTLSARLDARFVRSVPRKLWGKPSTYLLNFALIVSCLFSLLAILSYISGSGYIYSLAKELGGFFVFRQVISIASLSTLMLCLPLLLFFLLRTVLRYLFTGTYLRIGQGRKRLKAAKIQLSRLILGLDEAELNIVTAQTPNQPRLRKSNRHLSAELLRRNLAYVYRDINYYESLPSGGKTSTLGEHLLLEIERSIGMLAEEYQDIENTYLASFQR